MSLDVLQVLIKQTFTKSEPSYHSFLGLVPGTILDLVGDGWLYSSVECSAFVAVVLHLPQTVNVVVDLSLLLVELVRQGYVHDRALRPLLGQRVDDLVTSYAHVTRDPGKCDCLLQL